MPEDSHTRVGKRRHNLRHFAAAAATAVAAAAIGA